MVAQKIKNTYLKWVLLTASLVGGLQVVAHPMPSSVVHLYILENSIRGQANIPLSELQNTLGEKKTSAIKSLFLKNYFQKHIKALSNKKEWTTVINSVSTIEENDPIVGKYKEVLVDFELQTKSKNLRRFTFDYDVIIHQVITHKIFVYIEQDWLNGIQTKNKAKQIGIIQLDIPKGTVFPLAVNLEKGSWWIGFKKMVHLGIEHIQEGTDHLLFILVLLLPATLTLNGKKWGTFGGVKYSILGLLKIVTAFTLGHSVTLIISTLGWLDVPSQPTEVLIAISILVSAIHAICPIFPNKEIYVASGFGLIHGLAFATVLSNLNLDGTMLALSILGFNIGIEIMQLFVILLVIPWFIILSQTKYFSVIKNGLALLVIIISIGWVLQRCTTKDNFITTATNQLFLFSAWIIVGLSILSLTLFTLDTFRKKQQIKR